MNKLVMGVVVVLLLTGHAAFAAVQYEYFQTSRSEGDERAADFNARAFIDGQRSRIDFISGNTYPPGTYMISTDGARRLLFVDPSQKQYTEVSTLGIASAIGSSKIVVTNLQSSVTRLDDGRVIAGIPTDHYRLTMTYDITVMFRDMPLKQSVRTIIDKWTTVRFGDIADVAFGSPVQTGNDKIDELISAETTKIKGFPLRQMVSITTINNTGQTLGSKLVVPTTRTKTRETTVTAISEMAADDKMFRVPKGYQRTDFTDQVSKSQTQILSTSSSPQ
ncbi:MAG TPA: hypothetical protein VIM68_04365 [Thermoanaerobaculia bacterium]|jgi:hypothetical protein